MKPRSRVGDILSRRDPHGFYVIPLKKSAESALSGILASLEENQAKLVEAGDVVLVRVKSRSLAEKIARIAEKKGLLAEEEEL